MRLDRGSLLQSLHKYLELVLYLPLVDLDLLYGFYWLQYLGVFIFVASSLGLTVYLPEIVSCGFDWFWVFLESIQLRVVFPACFFTRISANSPGHSISVPAPIPLVLRLKIPIRKMILIPVPVVFRLK